MTLQNSLLIGFAGAFLMFIGDMFLYYDKNDYDSKDGVNSIIAIMKKVSKKRLYIGGILGPISAFVQCLGFYHMYLFMKDSFVDLGWIIFFLNCLGIICGGAYHSHCAYLGLLSRHDNDKIFNEFISYLKFQAKIVYSIMFLAAISLTIVLVLGWTVLPRWMVLFSPAILIFLIPLLDKLPKGLHIIIRGGWTNLVFVIYYLLALLIVG